jgi:hypothetical protein
VCGRAGRRAGAGRGWRAGCLPAAAPAPQRTGSRPPPCPCTRTHTRKHTNMHANTRAQLCKEGDKDLSVCVIEKGAQVGERRARRAARRPAPPQARRQRSARVRGCTQTPCVCWPALARRHAHAAHRPRLNPTPPHPTPPHPTPPHPTPPHPTPPHPTPRRAPPRQAPTSCLATCCRRPPWTSCSPTGARRRRPARRPSTRCR